MKQSHYDFDRFCHVNCDEGHCELIDQDLMQTLRHHCSLCGRDPHDVLADRHWRRGCEAKCQGVDAYSSHK